MHHHEDKEFRREDARAVFTGAAQALALRMQFWYRITRAVGLWGYSGEPFRFPYKLADGSLSGYSTSFRSFPTLHHLNRLILSSSVAKPAWLWESLRKKVLLRIILKFCVHFGNIIFKWERQFSMDSEDISPINEGILGLEKKSYTPILGNKSAILN